MANAILRETGRSMTADEASRLVRLHAEAYARLADQVRPLPGARELLAYLTQAGVPWAIATSGRHQSARLLSKLWAWRQGFRSLPATRWSTPNPTPTCSSPLRKSWA